MDCTTSSPAPRSSAASPTSTPSPTTCSPRTSASWPRRATPRSRAHREGKLEKVTYMSSSMVFESADSWPSFEGQEREVPPPISSYGFQKLAVEYYARRRAPAVRAAVHDRATVQLRRSRRDARAVRRRGAERQREAGDEPRGARPRAEGRQGPGPAAHPRRRQPGPSLHLRRRPRQGHRHRDGASRRARTKTSTSRPPSPRRCSSSPRTSGAGCEGPTRRSAT